MKKTLATLLVVALVASLCGVMFVSAEEVNVALGKTWTTDADDADAGTGYVGNVTDGTIEETGAYDTTLWFGADRRKTDDDAFAMVFDLGETYDSLSKVNLHVWPAAASGIVVPASIDVYTSADGETYTKVGSVSEFDGTGPQWVTVEFDAVAARYVKVDFVSSVEGDTGVFWFVSEIEIINVTAAGNDEPAPEAPTTNVITVSHVNLYSWNAYNCQIISGEGNDSNNYEHTAFDATAYIVIKVENDVVTAIEGAGVAKTLTAPAEGYLLYCAPNDSASMAAAANVKVGDVVVDCTVDLGTNVASATPIGTITFGAATPATGDASVLVFVVLAVVALAGVAVASKAKSAL
ncbi:MAG: discoidin domain-containing protein [Clostridia bacterium]|nr:discoidin domain-containing protein [Clostridia bacterium]